MIDFKYYLLKTVFKNNKSEFKSEKISHG